MLVWSANTPNSADPTPPIPKAKPKNKPETIPTFPGNNSCAYTSIAEKALAMITPIKTDSTLVQKRLACGNKRVKGAAPNIENQITYLRPNLSPKGPPNNVPAATENRKINRYNCEL